MSLALQRIMKYVRIYNTRGFDRLMDKVKIVSSDSGTCVAEFKVEEEHLNSVGPLHGSFAAMLVDNISTYALIGLLENQIHIPACMDISYIKPANQGAEAIVDSRMLNVGRKLAFILVTLKDKQTGELLVHGTHTKYILEKEINLS